MGKNARDYRMERDEALVKCEELQKQLDEALDKLTIREFYPLGERVVVRIDTTGYKHKGFLDFLLRSNQFGGLNMGPEDNWLDIIGVLSPDMNDTIMWQDGWGDLPQILVPRLER